MKVPPFERFTSCLQLNDRGNITNLHEAVSFSLAKQFRSLLRSKRSQFSRVNALLGALAPAEIDSLAIEPHIAGHLLGEITHSDEDLCYFIAAGVGRIAKSGFAIGPVDRIAIEDRFEFDDFSVIPPMDRGGTDLAAHSEPEEEAVRSKLRAALHNINIVSPPAFDLVEKFLWRTALRREQSFLNVFSSGTFQTTPGLALVCNAHLARVSVPQLEEALVHESIHCFLFWAEDTNNRLLRTPDLYAERVISPWTGASIGLHSALHAAAVWFGLRNYFLQRLRTTGLTTNTYSGEKIDFIERGYRAQNFANFRSILRNACAPSYWDGVGSLLDVAG